MRRMFTRLTSENMHLLTPFYKAHHPSICDNTAGAVYQWRNAYVTYFSISGGMLCIRASYGADGDCYTFPIGDGDIGAALEHCQNEANERGDEFKFCVTPIEGLNVLNDIYGERVLAQNRREWADYLYDAEGFLSYSGKQYHTQRNHVNRFFREYPQVERRPVTKALEGACFDFLCRYAAEHDDMNDIEKNELIGAKELLIHREALGQSALCLTLDDEVIALSIGERRFDTLYVHVEKARMDIAGAYPAMAQAFVQAHEGVKFVNREDDAGDEGLRYSKLNYRPIALIDKYFVKIQPSSLSK